MSDPNSFQPDAARVPADLVEAAIRAAARYELDVADLPVVAIAHEAGVSRSTLLRRVGGSRGALDEAVRAAGVDPGGRSPVRERAVESGAWLISEHGLAAVTLEAVAGRAECSVHSLYAAFSGRDQLLYAIFDRYTPVLDIQHAVAVPDTDLAQTVERIYRLLAEVLTRQPRVVPALLAEALSGPDRPGASTVSSYLAPRMFAGPGEWLAGEIAAGRVRDLPLHLLLQQMLAPIVVHFLTRPAAAEMPQIDLSTPDDAVAVLAGAFLRAVAVPTDGRTTTEENSGDE